LQAFAPWAITPLLMLGGAYLCYEGTEKVYEALFPHKAHAHEAKLDADAGDGQALEARKVSSAIKTDFILSAEIMAISLASLPEGSIWTKAIVLAVVAIGITVFVYGGVALIVKADDAGVAMAKNNSASVFGSAIRGFGRALVKGMPVFLQLLAVVGTAAMIWVGGGILVHGLEGYGLPQIAHAIHEAAAASAKLVPPIGAIVEWIVTAIGSGLVGLVVGGALIPITAYLIAPLWSGLSGLRSKTA
jgi:predicted DNA repair protein MutK